MTSDREFLDWAPAWRAHDCLLRTRFMLKPFILDPFSAIYQKQFKQCKLNQALLGMRGSAHDYMCSPSQCYDVPKPASDKQRHQASSLPTSPRYMPYPKPPHPSANPSATDHSFRDPQETSLTCVRCGNKGHRASDCSAKRASHPECSIIVVWNQNRLETMDGKHICLLFNVRGACTSVTSDRHGSHSCSLCGDSCHGARDCTHN